MTNILEDFYQYYNFSSGLKLIHFLFMPVLLFSGIFSLTAIPIHYNVYNLSDVVVKSNVSDYTFNDVWKTGFVFNVASIVIAIYFMIYIVIDCISSILFLVETTLIWYITNILYFIYDVQKNKTTIPFAVIPGILVALTFYLIHICCVKSSVPFKDICYFPLILIFLPLFTIFNTIHSFCGHKMELKDSNVYYNNDFNRNV